jgi:type IV pilus assembly protein PilA
MKKIKNNKGFTLVELIVVMAIMAILVGALAPQVVKYVERARESKDLQLVSTVYTAVQTAIASSEETVVDQKWALESVTDTTSLPLLTEIKSLLATDMSTSTSIITKCKSTAGKTSGNEVYVAYDKATGYLGVYIATDPVTFASGVDTPTEFNDAIKNSSNTKIGPVSNQ